MEAQRVEPDHDGRIGRHRGSVTKALPRIRDRPTTLDEREVHAVAKLDEQRAVPEWDDARSVQDRTDAIFTFARPSASRTARAISAAPGVSPCMQSVST